MSSPRLAHNVFLQARRRVAAEGSRVGGRVPQVLNVQPGIVFFAAGEICAELDRDVNDRDWHVGLHLVFVDKAAHDAYQDDATHNQFIDENKPNWAGVRVFDSLV